MNLDRLRLFVCVVEHGSLSAAARKLAISQPAVSMAIKALEKALGATLLERGNEGTRLTRVGEQVYASARRILAEWERLNEQIQQTVAEPQGPLLVGASTTPGTYMLPRLLETFHRQYPKLELYVHIYGSAQVKRQLLDDRIDVGLVGSPMDHGGVRCEAIADDELWLIGPVAEAFYAREGAAPLTQDPWTATDLLAYPFVMRETGSGTRETAAACLHQHRLSEDALQAVAVMANTEAVIATVEAGVGIAFASQWAAEPAVRAGRVRRLPFHCKHLRRRIYCIYREHQQQRRAVQAFVAALIHAFMPGATPGSATGAATGDAANDLGNTTVVP